MSNFQNKILGWLYFSLSPFILQNKTNIGYFLSQDLFVCGKGNSLWTVIIRVDVHELSTYKLMLFSLSFCFTAASIPMHCASSLFGLCVFAAQLPCLKSFLVIAKMSLHRQVSSYSLNSMFGDVAMFWCVLIQSIWYFDFDF